MNSIQLIAMDMDGTLLNSKGQISEGNRKALQEAQAKGIHLAICSGRCPGDIFLFARENGFHCTALSLNGTYCLAQESGVPFGDHVFPVETSRRIYDILKQEDTSIGLFCANEFVITEKERAAPSDFWVAHMNEEKAPHAHFGEEYVSLFENHGYNKILALFYDEAAYLRTGEKLRKVEGLNVSSSNPTNYELMPLGFDKATAVSEMAQSLHLDASQVMTIGDYDNDASMIAWAGYGTAMGNGSALVKRIAKYHTLTNDEDGVAYAIRKWALNQ